MRKLKKILVITLLTSILSTQRSYSFDENQTFNVAGVKLSAKICAQLDKISAFTSQLTNVNWTVTGAPGITMGVITNPSVILDFCNALNQMQHLSIADASFAALELGNKMMGNKFDDELNFMRETYDLSATTIDMSGKGRGLAGLYSANYARRLNSWMKTTSNIHDKYRPDDPINLQTRQQKEADMQRLSRLASRRAVLNDLTDCPKGRTGDEKIANLYQKDVLPVEEKLDIYKGYVEHFRETLKQMAIPSIARSEFENFLMDLSSVEVNGVSYDIEVATKTVDTVKRVEIKKTSTTQPTDPRSKEVTEKLQQKYQLFKLKENPELLSKFLKKYYPYWDTYSKLEGTSTIKNLANNPVKNNVERQFTDYSLLCNKAEIRQKNNLNTEDSDYFDKLNELFDQCKIEKDIEISAAGGLFKHHAEELQKYNKLLKEAQAYIWTFESYYFGYFRAVEGQVDQGITQEKATCSQVGNLGYINDLMAKQGSLNLEINQELVAETMKQNALLEQEKADKEKALKEAERKRRIDEEVSRRMSHEFSGQIAVPRNSSGM